MRGQLAFCASQSAYANLTMQLRALSGPRQVLFQTSRTTRASDVGAGRLQPARPESTESGFRISLLESSVAGSWSLPRLPRLVRFGSPWRRAPRPLRL